MGKYVTVSARIRRELKEEMEKLGIKPSEVIKRAIEESVRRRKLEILEERLRSLSEKLSGISEEDWASAVRETREER